MERFSTVADRTKNLFETLSQPFGWNNTMEATKIEKVVVSSGIGRMKDDKNRHKVVQDRLERITGQKPAPRKAKKSIASFKLRQGEVVGYQVTINKSNIFDFLTRLFFVALPRSRDFRGIPLSAIDATGNITVGISEHTIFPEVSDEDISDIFGLSVCISTTAETKEEAIAFLRHIGLPLKKE